MFGLDMKVMQDIYVQSKSLSPENIIICIEQFTHENPNWGLLPSQTKKYAAATENPVCMVHSLARENNVSAAIALMACGKRSLKVTNIVPEESGRLTMDQYNRIAQKFTIEFNEYARKHKKFPRAQITPETIGLDKIITGKKTRKFFERYLNAYPTSWHPLDIKRLDTFICAVSRYHCEIDLNRLACFLTGDAGWSEQDARRCCERIEIGVEVLKIARKF